MVDSEPRRLRCTDPAGLNHKGTIAAWVTATAIGTLMPHVQSSGVELLVKSSFDHGQSQSTQVRLPVVPLVYGRVAAWLPYAGLLESPQWPVPWLPQPEVSLSA